MSKKIKIEKSDKKEKWNIFTSGNELDAAVLKGPRIELFSNTQIMIEGCGGVLEYNENYLKLRLPTGALVLCGEDFDIVNFFDKSIVVRGKINSLEFAV